MRAGSRLLQMEGPYTTKLYLVQMWILSPQELANWCVGNAEQRQPQLIIVARPRSSVLLK